MILLDCIKSNIYYLIVMRISFELTEKLVKALAAQRPDCDFEDDSEMQHAELVRREALQAAKDEGFEVIGE